MPHDPTQCDDGYEWDGTECVAVSCAADPCPDHLDCVDLDYECTTAPCFKFRCVSPTTCDEGYEYDDILDQCVPVSCDAPDACPGLKVCVDAEITCVRAPCPQFTCEYDQPETDPPTCTHGSCSPGYYCDYGICCPLGTAYDSLAEECVAVSCAAPEPCDEGEKCVAASIQCIRPPCPQFTCEADDSSMSDPCENDPCREGFVCHAYEAYWGGWAYQCLCPDNTQWSPGYGCVALNCEVEDACSEEKECIPYERHCYFPGPCPQYYCD